MKPDNNENPLKKTIPHAKGLNKMAVVGVVGVLALCFFFGFLKLFEPSNNSSRAQKTDIHASGTGDEPETTVLNGLPDHYSDQAMLDYRQKLDNDNNNKKMTEELMTQLTALKDRLQTLENQKNQPAKPVEEAPQSADDQAAIRSQIFLPGGYPVVNSQSDAKSTSSSKDSKTDQDKKPIDNKTSEQQDKLDFIQQASDDDSYNENQMRSVRSPYEVKAGTIIPAILQSEVISNLPGEVLARVRQPVYDTVQGQHLLIPQGTVIVGKYNSQISYGQSQVQVVFTRLIRPDGSSIQLQNEQASDVNGATGVQDQLDNHWGELIGAAVLTTLFDVPSVVAGSATYETSGDITTQTTSAAQVAAQSVGQASTQVGTQVTQRAMNIAPTVTIHSGKLFNIMVNKDMIIPPYKGD